MFRGKNYKESAKLIDKQALYDPMEAFGLLIKTSKAKFDETVELHVKLGVDGRHADQQVRGAIVLPNGTGKTVRVLVFCKPEKVDDAIAAGADYAGGMELVEKIQKENWFEFDVVIATPDMMGVIGRLGKVLGPKGLMPNPKAGTVTPNVAQAIKELKADWIMNVDADEFWYTPTGSIKQELSQAKGNVVHCPIRSMYPEENTPYTQWNKRVEFVSNQADYELSTYSIFERQRGKVAHRTDGYLQIGTGNHKVTMLPKKTVETGILIYHYNVGLRDAFIAKMVNGGKQF